MGGGIVGGMAEVEGDEVAAAFGLADVGERVAGCGDWGV